ncbi:MAG TPA: choice-of-anchor D domain-containing protein [Candidatus Kapabacteria bacterium]|nr:choice-of-anchor D domain-containing protein [Candidatus Kapabacteria bacterium]
MLDGKNLYAASGSTCVWGSSDSGATWELTPAKLVNADDIYRGPSGNIQGMNISGTGMMRGSSFAGLNALICVAARDDQVRTVYSTDGGANWSNAAKGMDSPDGYCMIVDTCTGGFYTITDGTKAELWSSMDGGNSWNFIHDFVSTSHDVIDGGVDGVFYVLGTSNVWMSVDAGSTFQSIGGPATTFEDRRIFAFGPLDDNLVVLNNGAVWLYNAQPIPPGNEIHLNQDTTVQGCSISSIDITVDSLSGIDSVRIHATANNGGWISPADTALYRQHVSILRYRIAIPPGEATATFSFGFSIRYLAECGKSEYGAGTVTVHLVGANPMIKVPNPTLIPVCTYGRVPIVFTASPCDTVRIDSIPSLSAFAIPIAHKFPDTVLPGSTDTFWVDVDGAIPGNNVDFYKLMGVSVSSGRIIDTPVMVSSKIVPYSKKLILSSGTTTASNCRESILPLILQALPCDSVRFNSCTLTVDGSLKYNVNQSFPQSLAAGEADTLLINFPPQNLNGVYIITAHVTGKYLGSSITFDTTIQIRVTFTSSAGALAASSAAVALDTLSVCTAADTIVTFKNLGCDSITVTGDATVWQPGWSTADPSFPLTLAPNSSFTVRVHYRPMGPMWSEQFVSYNFNDIGGKAGTSLPFALTVTAVPAMASLSLNDTALNFGTFSRCNASGDTTVTLTNSGCDTLSLSGAAVAGGSGFTLVDGVDTVLAPNQSVKYKIHFSDSIAGSLASALDVHAVGAHGGDAFDTSVSCSASIVAGSHLATLSTQAINFGTTSICEERDSTITISNIGCEPDTIFAIKPLSDQFVLSDTLVFPIILPPEASKIVSIATNLDTAGHPSYVGDTLDFISNLDSALAPVALSRGVTYPGRFSLGLKTEDSAAISATVPVYVLRKGTIPSAADEVDFDLIYNDDLLNYLAPVEPDIQMINASLLPNGLTDRSFAMKPARDRDTIATLEFKSYLAKQEHTPITLSSEKFISGGAISPPCVASINSGTDAGFTLELACGDAPLVNALTGLPLNIASMNVSPDLLRFTLNRGDPALTSCTAEILTILGSRAFGKTFDLGPVTSSSFVLHALPAGAYFLRISTGRSVITRRFVVVK